MGFSKPRTARNQELVSDTAKKSPLNLAENVEHQAGAKRSGDCEISDEAGFGHTIIRIPGRRSDERANDCSSSEQESSEMQSEEASFMIRLADTPQGRNAASLLINKMYSWRGYQGQHVVSECPNRITLTASDKSGVVGTATLGLDCESGLLADMVFREQIDAYRRKGAQVCEITKLAFDTAVRSKYVIASLFHIIFIYGRRLHGCTDVFIEINPRHRIFYERMLGFQKIDEVKENPRVKAPAVLLWANIAEVEKQIKTYGGQVRLSIVTRSLYPYFFSPREEEGLVARLMLLDRNG